MKGIKIKEYKGVNIYVNTEGTFFCNFQNNEDSTYYNKTSESQKLDSIEKAIDNFKGNDFVKNYITLNYSNPYISSIKAVGKIGNIIIFKDGFNSLNKSHVNNYYEVEIKEDIIFENIQNISKDYISLEKEIYSMNIKLMELRKEYSKNLTLVNKYKTKDFK